MNIKLTNAGISLAQRGQLGANGTYTRIVLGDGFLPDGQTLVDTTQINNPVLEITGLSVENDGEIVVVKGSLVNEIEFFGREIGLYAMDPDLGEVLVAYGNAGSEAELVTVTGEARPIKIRQFFSNALSDFESTIFATLADMAGKVDKVEGMGLVSDEYIQGVADDIMAVNNSILTVNNNLQTHTSDQIIHVTQADRDKWDAGGGGGGAKQPYIVHKSRISTVSIASTSSMAEVLVNDSAVIFHIDQPSNIYIQASIGVGYYSQIGTGAKGAIASLHYTVADDSTQIQTKKFQNVLMANGSSNAVIQRGLTSVYIPNVTNIDVQKYIRWYIAALTENMYVTVYDYDIFVLVLPI